MGKSNKAIWVIAIAFLIIALPFGVSMLSTSGSGGAATGGSTTGGTSTPDLIAGQISPTGQVVVGDKLSLGTKLTKTAQYRVAGTADTFKQSLTETDISFTPEKTYEIYLNSSSEYVAYTSGVTIPAQENVPEDLLSYKAYDHAAASSMTSTIIDQTSNAANTAAANKTFTAGTNPKFDLKTTGQSKKAYGNPDAVGQPGENCNNVVTIRGNTSSTDDIILYMDGVEIPDNGPVPKQSTFVAQTHQSTWSFYVPAVVGAGTRELTIEIDTDDTNTNLNSYNITEYDGAMYINSDDNMVHCGIEDEDNADVGISGHLDDLIVGTLGE